MEINCPFGLGNRVAAIANGLSRAREIRFFWPVNHHCPVASQTLFPDGIPGVVFSNEKPPLFATRWGGMMAHCWDAAACRWEADKAYALVMRNMVGDAAEDAPLVAILGRFHRNHAGTSDVLACRAWQAALGAKTDRVFLLSDCHRDRIRGLLMAVGIDVEEAKSRPLGMDLDRTDADILAYAGDWKTVLAARVVVALDGPASALHPVRSAGIPIVYA